MAQLALFTYPSAYGLYRLDKNDHRPKYKKAAFRIDIQQTAPGCRLAFFPSMFPPAFKPNKNNGS
jgi:hypothetical protein